MKSIYKIIAIALFLAVGIAVPAFAAPQNINELEKISYDISENGLVHGLVDKKDLAAQSASPLVNLNSRKAIMNEIYAAPLSPVLNIAGAEKANNISIVDGVIILGSSNAAPEAVK